MFIWRQLIHFIVLSLIAASLVFLAIFGYLWPNNLFANRYAVQGIDVSNHQKTIDWEKVGENEKFRFVFIKATEGEDFQDSYFAANWAGAKKAGFLCGAYHYFTMTSSGKNQAANFIRVVPAEEGSLPPVVDVETTGVDRDALLAELRDLVGALEKAYEQKPILYVVRATYNDYIKGEFDSCPLWIRDIVKPPALSGGVQWHFWQYCSRGHIDGIDTYVDLNVFYGDSKDLESLLSEE